MKNYLSRIEEIKKQFSISEKEHFIAALNGTNYKVFLSNNYVIRFRDDNTKLLLKEANFLKQLKHALIPKILWFGEINQSFFMVENRLSGQTINLAWKDISENSKQNIIEQIIKFLKYQKTQVKTYVYSVKTGKQYENFLDYLTDDIKQKIVSIKKFKQANKIVLCKKLKLSVSF